LKQAAKETIKAVSILKEDKELQFNYLTDITGTSSGAGISHW
jgi:hypothetical protein